MKKLNVVGLLVLVGLAGCAEVYPVSSMNLWDVPEAHVMVVEDGVVYLRE